MINKLIIERFGKFINKTFVLSPVTVFIGKNESGKTTLFDALFDCICSPKGNITHGKRLNDRYGSNRKVKIRFNKNPISIDPDEFLNLYAIHSGNIILDFARGKNWTDRVKSSLFSGGIDPARIRDNLAQEASNHAGKRHIKQLRKIEKEKEDLEETLEKLKNKKKDILNNELNIIKFNKKLKELDNLIEKKGNKISLLSFNINQQRKIKEKHECMSILQFLDKGEKLENDLNKLSGFKEDKTQEFIEIENKIKKKHNLLKTKEGYKQSLQSEIHDVQKKIDSYKRKKDIKKIFSELASGFLSRIQYIQHTQAGAATGNRKKGVWNILLVLSLLVLLTIGIGSFILLEKFEYKIIIIVLSILCSLIPLFFLIKVNKHKDIRLVNSFINKIKDEWRVRAKEESEELKSNTIDGLMREFMQYESDYDAITCRLNQENDELLKRKENLKSKQDECILLEKEIKYDENLLINRLREKGITSCAEYYNRIEYYKNLKKTVTDRQEELNEKLKQLDIDNADSLRTECHNKSKTLEKEITHHKKPQTEIHIMEAELNKNKEEIKPLKDERNKLKGEIDVRKGMVKGSFSGIPEEIVKTTEDIRKYSEEITELNLSRFAADFACNIFDEIVKDSDTILLELSRDIADHFGKLLPEVRKVKITGLDKDNPISISDAGGQIRQLDYLSKGTKDLFLFAARLALARRSRIDKSKKSASMSESTNTSITDSTTNSILVLDEPFYTLDAERKEKTLLLLKNFHDMYGWQIILFSIDEKLSACISKIFNDLNVKIYEL